MDGQPPPTSPTQPPPPVAPPAPQPAAPGASAAPPRQHPKETIKDTLVSIIIAFVLAFVFRGFVVEAFVIPTGSMAPTLMGAHMRFRAPESGMSWPVGPWYPAPGMPNEYKPIQGQSPDGPIVVHDPMTGQRIEQANVRRRSGDRILVLKFLFGVFEPRRYDVVVFKNPTDPRINFIKRLVGLPGEEIALVDGDVFTRPASAAQGTENPWAEPGWTIARKPHRVQQAVWQEVFDSRYAPLNPRRDGRLWYHTPWVAPSDPNLWDIEGQRIYTYRGTGPTTLEWDAQRPRYSERGAPWMRIDEFWQIDDRYPYNEDAGPTGTLSWMTRFPVSDVRLRAGIEPAADGLVAAAVVAARGHEFKAVLDRGAKTVTIRMREALGTGSAQSESAGSWRDLASAPLPASALAPGRVTDAEFWHVDQSLQVWIDGTRIAYAEYDWTPTQRIAHATGHELSELMSQQGYRGNVLADGALYRPARVRWEFQPAAGVGGAGGAGAAGGASLALHRVGLDRDLFYQPGVYRDMGEAPALATNPASTARLSGDEYFCLGDNSPASQDGRLWGDPDPWVARQLWEDRGLEPKAGVVPRELLIGKAFFVYFPSLHRDGAVPVPDFGRLRFIW